MNPLEQNELDVFKTSLSMSKSQNWFSSLITQFREWQQERRNPTPRVEITAEKDPSALNQFVNSPSPFVSLWSSLGGVIGDTLHPRKIEMTATPVEVEQLWSKHNVGLPMLMSGFLYAGMITLLLIPWATAPKLPDPTETAVLLLSPKPLKLDAPKDDGGGGGGKRQQRPPSAGVLPKIDKVQFVPPDPEPPKNRRPEIAMEMSVVSPIISQPMVGLLPIGDPFAGIPGPPSSGPGNGNGIGTGDGNGIGPGTGPGAGPGTGGVNNTGTLRVGGDVSSPTCVPSPEPQYSEDARKSRTQGIVTIAAIVKKDGSVQVNRVVRGLGQGLDENAMVAARQWKCRPAMRNGAAVDVSLNIEVKFTLR